MNKRFKLEPEAQADGSFTQKIGPFEVLFEESEHGDWAYQVLFGGEYWIDDGNYESLEEVIGIVEDELTAVYRAMDEALVEALKRMEKPEAELES